MKKIYNEKGKVNYGNFAKYRNISDNLVGRTFPEFLRTIFLE